MAFWPHEEEIVCISLGALANATWALSTALAKGYW
jgi:hypothetical protein